MSPEERLERLERENRRLKAGLSMLGGLALIGLAFGLIGLACARGPAPAAAGDVLRIKRLEILDEKGAAVVVLSADGQQRGRIVTFDSSGRQLVQIASTEEGGTVAAAGKEGKLRAGIGVAKNDAGNVFTFDTNGQRLLSLGTGGTGDGAVFSYLRNGELRAMWP